MENVGMTQTHIENLIEHKAEIKSRFKTIGINPLCTELRASWVLNDHEEEEIRVLKSPSDKLDMILDVVVKSADSAFYHFIKALEETNHKPLAELLKLADDKGRKRERISLEHGQAGSNKRVRDDGFCSNSSLTSGSDEEIANTSNHQQMSERDKLRHLLRQAAKNMDYRSKWGLEEKWEMTKCLLDDAGESLEELGRGTQIGDVINYLVRYLWVTGDSEESYRRWTSPEVISFLHKLKSVPDSGNLVLQGMKDAVEVIVRSEAGLRGGEFARCVAKTLNHWLLERGEEGGYLSRYLDAHTGSCILPLTPGFIQTLFSLIETCGITRAYAIFTDAHLSLLVPAAVAVETEESINMSWGDKGQTALHRAGRWEMYEMWHALSRHKHIDMNAQDWEGNTPVMLWERSWADHQARFYSIQIALVDRHDVSVYEFNTNQASWLSDPRIDVSLSNHAGETLLDWAITAAGTLPQEAGMWIYSVIAQIGSHPSATEEIRQRAERELKGWKKTVKKCARELVSRCSGEVVKNHNTCNGLMVASC